MRLTHLYARMRLTGAATDPVDMMTSRGRSHAVLLCIVAAAVLLRLPSMLNDGLWRDEANIYVQLAAPTFGQFFERVIATEWHPPLYFLIVYAWMKVVGTTELTIKVLPFIFSIATIPVVYRLGKAAVSSRVGILAAAMYAIAPIAISYSTEYLYPLMGLLCTVLAWLVTQARREERVTIGRFVAITGVTLLTVYTHYVALFYVPMLTLWALTSRDGIRHGLAVASAMVLGALPFVFWLPVFLNQRHIGVPYASQATTWDKASFFSQTLVQYAPAVPQGLAFLGLGLLVVAVVMLTSATSVRSDAGVLSIVSVSTLALISAENLKAARYALPLYGLLCVSLASVFAEFIDYLWLIRPLWWSRLGLWTAAVLSVLIVIENSSYVLRRSEIPKSGIRTLVRARTLDPEALYILAPDYLASTFAFYARTDHVTPRGFVRWADPEVFRLAGYADDWSKADAVRAALDEIAGEERHYKYLDVIVDEYAGDQGQVPYGKVWQLLSRLEARYKMVSRTRYPGRNENVSEYVFIIPRVATRRAVPGSHHEQARWKRTL